MEYGKRLKEIREAKKIVYTDSRRTQAYHKDISATWKTIKISQLSKR